MILDNDLMFSDAQAVTAAARSTNVIDTAPLFAGNTGRRLGISQLYLFISVDVTMTDASSDSTLTVDLQTDDNSAFSSAATIMTLMSVPALSVAGSKWFFRLPISSTVPYERYISLLYTPVNGNLSTGAFSAGLVANPDLWESYISAVTTGVG